MFHIHTLEVNFSRDGISLCLVYCYISSTSHCAWHIEYVLNKRLLPALDCELTEDSNSDLSLSILAPNISKGIMPVIFKDDHTHCTVRQIILKIELVCKRATYLKFISFIP